MNTPHTRHLAAVGLAYLPNLQLSCKYALSSGLLVQLHPNICILQPRIQSSVNQSPGSPRRKPYNNVPLCLLGLRLDCSLMGARRNCEDYMDPTQVVIARYSALSPLYELAIIKFYRSSSILFLAPRIGAFHRSSSSSSLPSAMAAAVRPNQMYHEFRTTPSSGAGTVTAVLMLPSSLACYTDSTLPID